MNLLLALLLAHSPSNVTFCPGGKAVTTIPLKGPAVCSTVGGGGGGAGLPADPAACAAGRYVIDQDAAGILLCAQVAYSQLSGVPTTFAPSAHTHPGSDVTTAVANATAAASVPWSGITSPPATYAPTAHTHPGGDVTTTVATATALAGTPTACTGSNWMKSISSAGATTCTQPAYSDISGTPAAYVLPTASTTLGGVKQAAACGAGNHVASIVAGELTCTADADGGAHAITSATHSDVDTAATAANDLLIRDAANTVWQHRALATTDLPAHLFMGAQHSDVDTAATTAGDLVVRNAANTQWTHQAIGGANTVLHGGATAPAFSAVVDADLSGAVGVSHGGLGAAVTPAAGTIPYGSSGTAHAELAAGTAGQVLRSGGAGAPVWVGAQTCTSSAATTCTITVARSGCTPVCGMGASAAGSTWVRAAVATTTLTCTFSTSGTNICNCFCP